MDRALNGHEQPVYSYGKRVGTRTVYNDRLLMFMLRNRAPDRFGGGLSANTGASGNNAIDRGKLARLQNSGARTTTPNSTPRRAWKARKCSRGSTPSWNACAGTS
jgi:hypothetical protein